MAVSYVNSYSATGTSGDLTVGSVVVGSGEGLLVLFSGFTTSAAAPAITDVTFNGASLTQQATNTYYLGTDDSNHRGAAYYLASPTPATASVVVDISNSYTSAGVGVYVVSGHDTSSMIRDYDVEQDVFGDPPSLTLTTVSGDMVFDYVFLRDADGAGITVGSGQTERIAFAYSGDSDGYGRGSTEAASGTSVDMTWSKDSSTGHVHQAFAVASASALADPSSVTAGTATPVGFTLTWTDNSTGETGFDVQYSPSPYSSWTTASNSPAAANATSLVLTGLADGTSYKGRVRAAGGSPSAYVESGAITTTPLTKLRPNADTTVGTATSTGATLYEVVDETTANDADYITIPGTLTSVAIVQGHPSETSIKSWTPSPGASFEDLVLTMTSGEASAITDYTDLYVKIVTSSTTTKLKFENATDPGSDDHHSLRLRARQV